MSQALGREADIVDNWGGIDSPGQRPPKTDTAGGTRDENKSGNSGGFTNEEQKLAAYYTNQYLEQIESEFSGDILATRWNFGGQSFILPGNIEGENISQPPANSTLVSAMIQSSTGPVEIRFNQGANMQPETEVNQSPRRGSFKDFVGLSAATGVLFLIAFFSLYFQGFISSSMMGLIATVLVILSFATAKTWYSLG